MAIKDIKIEKDEKVLVELPCENKRVLVSVQDDGVQVVSDKCRHRGGPIHLCYLDDNNVRRCPWHDKRVLKDDVNEDICATYLAQQGVLRLLSSSGSPDDPWPTRVLTREHMEQHEPPESVEKP